MSNISLERNDDFRYFSTPTTSDQSLSEVGDLLEAVLDQLSIVGFGEEPLELLSGHIPVQGRPQ